MKNIKNDHLMKADVPAETLCLHNLNAVKDRQHRTRGGIGFSYITHKPRGAEYHVIYQMKAMIFVYALVLSIEI